MTRTQKIIRSFVGLPSGPLREFRYAVLKIDLVGWGGVKRFTKGQRVKVYPRPFGRNNWVIEVNKTRFVKPFLPLLHRMCGVQRRHFEFVE